MVQSMGSFSLLRSSNTLEPAPVTPRKARRKSDTTPPERVSLFRSLWPGASSSKPAKEKELPIHITEKIWGLVFEEDRVSWNQSCRSPKLTDRYKQYLLAAAAGLEEMEPEWDNVMVLNLGPTWSSSEAYKIFKDKVLEPANHSWECPPGLGICGLDALFSVCQQIHRWLAVDDANVVVLHCRGFSGAGLLFLYLITACYGLYSREFSRLDDAFEALPNPKTQHVATSTGEMLKLKGTLGAAQRHYGEYMLKVMYSQTLPSARRSKMSLQRIVFNACDQIRMGQPVGEPGLTASPSQPERSSGSSSSTPKHSDRRFSTIQSAFLVVYQRGVQVWAGAAATEDSMVGYEINRPISGDITIGLWFGDHKGEWDSPVMAYAFHTAFADHGLKRVRALHIDVPGNSAFDPEVAETEGFFMDIMLEEELLPVDARVSQDLDARGLQELKYEWQATIAQYDSPAKHSSVRHNMIRELRATQEAGLAPSELEAATGLTGADADASTSSPDSASASTAGQAGANTEPSRPAPAPAAAKKGPPPPPPPPPPGGKPAGSPGPKGPPPPPPPPGGKGPPVAPPPPPGGTRKGPPLPPPPMPGKGKTRRNSGEAAAAAGGHALAAGSAVLGPEQASIGAGTAALAPGYGPPKFRVLHWVKVPRGSTTLWAQLPAPIPGLPPPFPFALEQLFAVKPTKGLKGGKAKKGPTESVKVIGLARANNVSIMMTQFAEFKGGPVEVRHAVLTGSKLGMERLSLLLQIAPTDDEAKSLQKWLAAPGNRFSELSSPEQFLSVMATLPRLRAKVAALIFRRQYEGLMRDASGALACLNTACEQVRTSARLRKVIQSVLTVGNALNIGTAYGNAEGIQLSSLLKLAELKVTGPAGSVVVESRTAAGAAAAMAVQQAAAQAAIPPIRTLLEFVAWMVVSQAAAAGTLKKGGYLVEELSQLGEAVRRIQGDITESLKAMDAGVMGVELEFKAASTAGALAPSKAQPAAAAAQPPGLPSATAADPLSSSTAGSSTPPSSKDTPAAGGAALSLVDAGMGESGSMVDKVSSERDTAATGERVNSDAMADRLSSGPASTSGRGDAASTNAMPGSHAAAADPQAGPADQPAGTMEACAAPGLASHVASPPDAAAGSGGEAGPGQGAQREGAGAQAPAPRASVDPGSKADSKAALAPATFSLTADARCQEGSSPASIIISPPTVEQVASALPPLHFRRSDELPVSTTAAQGTCPAPAETVEQLAAALSPLRIRQSEELPVPLPSHHSGSAGCEQPAAGTPNAACRVGIADRLPQHIQPSNEQHAMVPTELSATACSSASTEAPASALTPQSVRTTDDCSSALPSAHSSTASQEIDPAATPPAPLGTAGSAPLTLAFSNNGPTPPACLLEIEPSKPDLNAGQAHTASAPEAAAGEPERLVDAETLLGNASSPEHQAMVAEEEARFAGVLGEFLESATNGKQQLMEMVKQTDVHVAQLAAWLGQPLDCDPAVMLGTLWTFALSFDQAARNMARCMAADTK